jgi:hypothetical protein
MSWDVKNKAVFGILILCFVTTNFNMSRLFAQEGQNNRFDGVWFGDFVGTKYFVTIAGNEITVQSDKSIFDEWVNFLEEERLNVAKGIMEVNGNYAKLTLTHIWGNLWAYFNEELFGDFDYWQTPEDFFEKYDESWEEMQNEIPEIFVASGVISGNRMRLNWNGDVQIITKQ